VLLSETEYDSNFSSVNKISCIDRVKNEEVLLKSKRGKEYSTYNRKKEY
jgi:hypothetical protein